MLADWIRSEGFEPVPVQTLSRAAEQIRDHAFDLFMSDFTFAFKSEPQLLALVRGRNAKTPIIAIGENDPIAESQATARNVTYLTRPLEQTSVTCSVAMAVMETRPTRRSLRKAVNRFDAIVDGVPSTSSTSARKACASRFRAAANRRRRRRTSPCACRCSAWR